MHSTLALKTSQGFKKYFWFVLFLVVVAVIGSGIIVKNNDVTNPTTSASALYPADLNDDGTVNISDLSLLISKWGTADTTADVNDNGIVNIFDLSFVVSRWGVVANASCATGEIGTPPNCLPAPPAPLLAGKQWKVLFNDEFDGTTLNTANFTPCFDWNTGGCTGSFNNGREWYYPAQVQLSNGTAKLVAEPLGTTRSSTACYNDICTYKSGLISTARPQSNNGSNYLHPFTYGYVETRLKYPSKSGFFTAFWMLPTNTSYTYRSEIDIIEVLGGSPNIVYMTYHYNNRSQSYNLNNGGQNNGACQVKNYSTGFARFGIDWEPNYIAWYIDGVKCGQFNGDTTTIENGPMQIIMDLMVDNDWQRSRSLVISDLNQTDQIEVDYLRVYQQQ